MNKGWTYFDCVIFLFTRNRRKTGALVSDFCRGSAVDIAAQFLNELKKLGAVGRFVSSNHLTELEDEFNKAREDKVVSEKMYTKFLDNYYDFSSLYMDSSLKSLCIIATPSLPGMIRFEGEDRCIEAEVPPIYLFRRDVVKDIKDITSRLLSNNGYKTIPVVLPKKSLAVHSGLAKYGRNNLVYVKGLGSYHRLTAFASDVPCVDDKWYQLAYQETCHLCQACLKNCPTGAICKESFIINADRCLTFFNEQAGSFPAWLNPAWHNSLIGCLACQRACPHNVRYQQEEKVLATFSLSETRLIVAQMPFAHLPDKLQQKLRYLCLDVYYDKLARNLAVLEDQND